MRSIVVTGSRIMEKAQDMARLPAMMAAEEQLGDLKLYRIPEPVTVASKGMKQVAFLDRDKVEGEFEYRAGCTPYDGEQAPAPMAIVLKTVNDKRHGLGAALPMGGASVFEPTATGEELLVGEPSLRDYAGGQDVELELAESGDVFAQCSKQSTADPDSQSRPWIAMRATITNARVHPVKVRLALGSSGVSQVRGAGKKTALAGLSVKDGQWVIERTIAPGKATLLDWQVREGAAETVE
jgi:hypothetical protein